MFHVTLNESADPILRHLRESPDELFGQPYGGVLLFLFGEADEQVASWFAKSVQPLDSLTGLDVACAVFAARIRIRDVHRQSVPARDAPRWVPGGGSGSEVQLGSIEYRSRTSISPFARPLVPDGYSTWHTEDLVATSRGADDVARALGVVDSLPCAIAMDGVPDNHFTIIPMLYEYLPKLFPALRQSIHRLRTSSGYSDYMNATSRVHYLGARTEHLKKRWREEQAEIAERQRENLRIENEIITADKELRDAAATGDMRRTRRALTILRKLSGQELENIEVVRASNLRNLAKVSMTIHGIQYWASRSAFTGNSESERRLSIILTRHASELLATKTFPNALSMETCINVINRLEFIKKRN